MPDFGELINKAKDLAGKHQDQVHKGVEKAEELAEKKLGDGSSDKVEKAGDMIEGFLGVHEPE
jgi:MT0933-like antitoxin protein